MGQGWERVAGSGSPLVLVAVDDPKGEESLSISLSEAGDTVAIARDGPEGLEQLRQLTTATVILDILLPKLDGWTSLTQVKADPATSGVPVIMVSILDTADVC